MSASAAENTETLEFVLVRQERKITLVGHDNARATYTVREMTGALRDQHFADMAAKTRPGPDGKPVMTDYRNIQSSFIAKCLFDERNNPVPVAVINEWPATVQEKVNRLCEEVNGMERAKDDDGVPGSVKND